MERSSVAPAASPKAYALAGSQMWPPTEGRTCSAGYLHPRLGAAALTKSGPLCALAQTRFVRLSSFPSIITPPPLSLPLPLYLESEERHETTRPSQTLTQPQPSQPPNPPHTHTPTKLTTHIPHTPYIYSNPPTHSTPAGRTAPWCCSSGAASPRPACAGSRTGG